MISSGLREGWTTRLLCEGVFQRVHTNAEEREAVMEALSINETCRSMGIGKTKLYALIKARDIPARKIGAKTIILRQDIDSYLSALPAIDLGRNGI